MRYAICWRAYDTQFSRKYDLPHNPNPTHSISYARQSQFLNKNGLSNGNINLCYRYTLSCDRVENFYTELIEHFVSFCNLSFSFFIHFHWMKWPRYPVFYISPSDGWRKFVEGHNNNRFLFLDKQFLWLSNVCLLDVLDWQTHFSQLAVHYSCSD